VDNSSSQIARVMDRIRSVNKDLLISKNRKADRFLNTSSLLLKISLIYTAFAKLSLSRAL
jgi:hypothetical protein